MKSCDRQLYDRFSTTIRAHTAIVRPLPGVAAPDSHHCFVRQLVDSTRRVEFVATIRRRDVSADRADPSSTTFDPVRAAVWHNRANNPEEAFWLVFLFVHFGKHVRHGYSYARAVYGHLGAEPCWDWPHASASAQEFRRWAEASVDAIRAQPGGFGNHRKYESIQALGRVVESYVDWVSRSGSHATLFGAAVEAANGDRTGAFAELYRSMNAVHRFGRTGRFDYLTMVGKLGLSPIAPGSAFLSGATGPVAGARLLFGLQHARPHELDQMLVRLAGDLGVGLQEMEDSVCNWQKSPRAYRRFMG